jgi:phosphatidylserine/phosphatidylglycerophosphate/cardiolipin synthase-like enzyme
VIKYNLHSNQYNSVNPGRITCFAALFMACSQASAFDLDRNTTVVSAPTTVRAVFTPQDDVAGFIVEAIHHAHKQVLVQAFSFTHGGIAKALIDAHNRGVEVKLIADREQTEKMEHGQVPRISSAGIPVWLDGEHQSAHNKVMVIDQGMPAAQVITGSFNFTQAAQFKNAENVVFLSGNEKLADAYARNWQQHLLHSQPLRIH